MCRTPTTPKDYSDELTKNSDIISMILEAADKFYNGTVTNQINTFYRQIATLKDTPFHPALLMCVKKNLEIMIAQFEKELRGSKDADRIQEAIFDIMAHALIVDNDEVIQSFADEIDWTAWHPLTDDDVEYHEIYNILVIRFPELRHFTKP